MKNLISSNNMLEIFGWGVTYEHGQLPKFGQTQRFVYHNPKQNMVNVILDDLGGSNKDLLADFACHPEMALHLWVSGQLPKEALENAIETDCSVEMQLETGLPEFPTIKLVVLHPDKFSRLGLPWRAGGATRDSQGNVLR